MAEPIRIGIVACDILKREIDKITLDDPDIVHKEYLEFGLHTYPEKLKFTVMDKVNSLEGKVDAVFLGYAICQSLKGVINELRVPAVMLEGDDCIATFLTPMGYAEEKRKCTGTWFNTPGWADLGIKGCIKELHLDSAMDQGYEPMYFMRMMFTGYSRCLFIDTGVEDKEHYESLSKDFAREMELRHESRDCSLDLLVEALESAKRLAREKMHAQVDMAEDVPAK